MNTLQQQLKELISIKNMAQKFDLNELKKYINGWNLNNIYNSYVNSAKEDILAVSYDLDKNNYQFFLKDYEYYCNYYSSIIEEEIEKESK